ncbi:hypothetical protein CVT25_002625 [Psilocybe cyanescens]|uniref:Uncharacterized protein n=1 Tax=Psilocybe cyanescens TaxID=93625 RepID=A0A409WLR3_PSICY|nr:hypothetical protein CVT25_002625 [Psilocybe cyanescens]
MAHPVLFEYIHLGKAGGMTSLCEALSLSRQLSNNQGCTLGWWTKRLDISMHDDGHDDTSVAEDLQKISGLLTCLPRLQILAFSVTGHGYLRYKSSHILNFVSCRESLKAIIWYNNYLRPDIKSWTTFLERHEKLEVIRGPFSVDSQNHVRLNALKILHPLLYYGYATGSDSMYLTNIGLSSVSCLDCEMDNFPIPLTIFERLGNQLTAIQFTYPNEILLPMVAAIEFGPIFAQLQSACHNLVRLNVILRTWPSFIQSLAMILIAPESLEILGIRIQRPQISNFGLKRLLQDALPMVLSKNPNLKVVQLLDKTSAEQFHLHVRILDDGLRKLRSLGITLQDHNGLVLAEARNFHPHHPHPGNFLYKSHVRQKEVDSERDDEKANDTRTWIYDQAKEISMRGSLSFPRLWNEVSISYIPMAWLTCCSRVSIPKRFIPGLPDRSPALEENALSALLYGARLDLFCNLAMRGDKSPVSPPGVCTSGDDDISILEDSLGGRIGVMSMSSPSVSQTYRVGTSKAPEIFLFFKTLFFEERGLSSSSSKDSNRIDEFDEWETPCLLV